MTLKEMSLAAANYIDAHGYQSNVNHGVENKKCQMTSKKSNDRVEFQKQVTFGPCSHCGLRNHRTEDCRCKPQTVRDNKTSDFTCFI